MARKRKVNPVQSVWELQWRERIEAWRRSGQTQQEFCRAHGLSAGSFSHWKAELVRRGGLRAPGRAGDGGGPVGGGGGGRGPRPGAGGGGARGRARCKSNPEA